MRNSLRQMNQFWRIKGAPASHSRTIPQPLRGYFNETLSLSFEKIDSAAAGLEIRLVKWPEVKPLLLAGKILLIDTRTAADYQARHIPGAISIPVETSDADMQIAMSQYPKNQPITVYCASASCSASRSFAERLINFGFTNVRDMAGGFAEYLQAGTETPGTK
jgi:rhodanese-related sulfurtransferase